MSKQLQHFKQVHDDAPSSKPQIVPQTKIAMIGYGLLLISMVIFLAQQPSGVSGLMMFLPNIIVFAIVSVIGLYVINCTVLGQCNIYAWVMGYVVAIIGILSVFAVIKMLMQKNGF